MKHDWTQGLNPEQKEAVLHIEKPLLILAGAGSGKTTVLVSRTGHILQSQKIKAKEICVLTFTTKAARELKHRVGHKVGAPAKDLWTGTFHSFGLKTLRKFHKQAALPQSFGVIDQGDSQGILKELMINVKNTSKDAFKVEKILSMMNDWRAVGQRKAKSDDDYEAMVEVLLPKYIKQLDLLGVVDFEGLLLRPLELFQNHPEILEQMQSTFKHLMVDEFQDTNRTQFRLVQSLVEQHQNIAVVGDDDQSIYGWRGACVSNILDFPKNFKECRVIRLERNYRSTPAILNIANQVIQKNSARHGKTLRPDPNAEFGVKPEVFVYENDDMECEEIARHITYFQDQGFKYNDVAILYRSNGQGALLEAILRQNQIPYALTGGAGFFDRKETKDVLAYLRCAFKPNEVALRRIINLPSRGIGETTIDKVAAFAQTHNISFVEAVKRWRELDISEKTGESIDQLFKILDVLPDDVLYKDLQKTCGELLVARFEEMGYKEHLAQTSKDSMSLEKRWMILELFGRVLDSFVNRGGRNKESLLDFVDCMELRDPGEDMDEAEEHPKVQMLTLHACKGLEFPAVILIGCEEDILPHRTLGSDVDEERRLFYVGVTRAKKRLILTRAQTRKRFGRLAPVAPSRFLLEIQPDSLTTFEMGFRPIEADKKQTLLADLFAKLNKNIETQKLDR